MRVLFYCILTITGVFLSLVIIAPSLFNIDTYKRKLIEHIYNKTGNKIVINQPIKLSLFPYAKVILKDIEFYRKKEEPLFSSKNITIIPNLLSLIKGEVSFKNIYLDNATLYVVIDKNGQVNWKKSLYEKKTSNEKEGDNKKKNNI